MDARRPEDATPPEPLEGEELVDVEVLDALPVPAASHELTAGPGRPLQAAQAAAVAATGFLAGAAAIALLQRRSVRRLAGELAELRDLARAAEAGRGRAAEPFGLVPGRQYLFHIRVLGRPPE